MSFLLGDVEFDVIEEETIQYINLPTEKPVEDGAEVVDHVHNRPTSVTIPGVIGDEDRQLAKEKFDKLVRYRDEAKLLTYVSEYVVLDDMVIVEFIPRRNVETGYGFAFDMEIKQIRIAEREYTEYLEPETIPEAKEEEEVGREFEEEREVEEDTERNVKTPLLRFHHFMSDIIEPFKPPWDEEEDEE